MWWMEISGTRDLQSGQRLLCEGKLVVETNGVSCRCFMARWGPTCLSSGEHEYGRRAWSRRSRRRRAPSPCRWSGLLVVGAETTMVQHQEGGHRVRRPDLTAHHRFGHLLQRCLLTARGLDGISRIGPGRQRVSSLNSREATTAGSSPHAGAARRQLPAPSPVMNRCRHSSKNVVRLVDDRGSCDRPQANDGVVQLPAIGQLDVRLCGRCPERAARSPGPFYSLYFPPSGLATAGFVSRAALGASRNVLAELLRCGLMRERPNRERVRRQSAVGTAWLFRRHLLCSQQRQPALPPRLSEAQFRTAGGAGAGGAGVGQGAGRARLAGSLTAHTVNIPSGLPERLDTEGLRGSSCWCWNRSAVACYRL